MDVMTEMRQTSGTTTAFGLLLVFLGMLAWMSPLFSGLTIAIMIGMIMIFGGIVGTIYAFKSPSFKEGIWKFLFGGVTLVFGFILLAYPGEGLGMLTIILTIFFILEGISKLVIAFKMKPIEGWGWVLFSGILSLLFAVIIIADWPVSGSWAVGITVGAYLLTFGLSIIAFGSTVSESVKEIQENRLTLLEAKYNMLWEAVQMTQVDIAAILILLNEKVSKSDVDPALTAINKELGDARVKIQEAADAAKKTGDDAQKKAGDLWEKSKGKLEELRKKIDETTKNLEKK